MMEEIKKELEMTENLQMTENGAVGYKSSGNKLVDLNFMLPKQRGGVTEEFLDLFRNSLVDDPVYTIKWMFFMRDIREGLGERDTFIKLFNTLYEMNHDWALNTLNLTALFGRWKDVVDIVFITQYDKLRTRCLELIRTQLDNDIKGCDGNTGISLLGKWLPSINASQKARIKAKLIAQYLGMPLDIYRKTLSRLRKYLDVTEAKTCANKWDEIDYNTVPSNANIRYATAFIRHDTKRYMRYLNDLKSGKSGVKMNASVIYPHEIWHRYVCNPKYSESYEQMWKNLKDLGDTGKTMCVCDNSGSMCVRLKGSSVEAIDISRSLSVYFAEKCTGDFHNRFIGFSACPRFIEMNDDMTLLDKIKEMEKYNDCTNTNIEAVFNLILRTAKSNNMSQEDMPDRILIISDMEFDDMTKYNDWRGSYCIGKNRSELSETLFEDLGKEYEKSGYHLPKLVFWNVNSRMNTIPLMENRLGVTLVSGFSINILKMVMSSELDAWNVLKETLDNKRYDIISERINLD